MHGPYFLYDFGTPDLSDSAHVVKDDLGNIFSARTKQQMLNVAVFPKSNTKVFVPAVSNFYKCSDGVIGARGELQCIFRVAFPDHLFCKV